MMGLLLVCQQGRSAIIFQCALSVLSLIIDQMGKRLMAKCRMLLQENEELGKMISSGRTAKLEAEIALHKTMVAEMKTNQDEMNEFVSELEEDVEGMQSMIYVLQQQLKDTKEHAATLEADLARLRTSQTTSSSVKQEPAKTNSSINSVTSADSSIGGGGDGVGTCGGDGCIPETTCNSSVEVPSVVEVRSETKSTSATASEANKARTTDSLSPQTSALKAETTQQTPSQGLGKRSSGGGDDIDGAQKQQANGRTTEAVVENSQHDCSLATADTSDLRTDQACDQAQSVSATKVQHDNQTADSLPKGDRDYNKPGNVDLKTVTPDANPIRNGGLEGVSPSGGESEK